MSIAKKLTLSPRTKAVILAAAEAVVKALLDADKKSAARKKPA
jgi:hypothetical protein